MTMACEKCGRVAPTPDSIDYAPWEADLREDGSVGVICPECLAKTVAAAIDEGEIWSELERLPPERLND